MNTSEAPCPTHVDLRSLSHASNRSAKQSQKCYNFRSGPMSRIGQPILSMPEIPRKHRFEFNRAPLLTHPDGVRARTWTKRDQFDERTWNIWPLDRKDHKVGRRKRGRGCSYVPARWEMERSMKGRRDLVDGDELEMEEDGTEDAAFALNEGCVSNAASVIVAADVTMSYVENSEDSEYDMLSDLSSEAGESDWEVI